MSNKTPLNPDLGLLLIRLMVGTVFLFHGAQKLFGAFEGPGLKGFSGYLESMEIPMPMVSAILAALAEFVGGIALVTGIYMRPIILTTAATMAVAALKEHGGAFDINKGGMEYPLTLLVVLVGLFFTGSGRLAMAAPKRKSE